MLLFLQHLTHNKNRRKPKPKRNPRVVRSNTFPFKTNAEEEKEDPCNWRRSASEQQIINYGYGLAFFTCSTAKKSKKQVSLFANITYWHRSGPRAPANARRALRSEMHPCPAAGRPVVLVTSGFDAHCPT